MLTSRALKSLQTTLMINLMLAVFWDCFHTAVEAMDAKAKTPPLLKSSFVNDLTLSTDLPTTLLTTGTTDRINDLDSLKFDTAVNTRTIEMVGIVLSFLTICASVVIFNAFPSLHNRRTVIHRNLFYALLMEVTVRMILYTQQSYFFDGVEPLEEDARKGIEYFPYVCEGAYVLLEYSRLVVYGWMFIEGIFLNTLISANTLRNEIPINYFYIGGWGVPAIVIAIWATVVGRHYSEEPLNTCWYGYNYLSSYYIIQGPILAIVLLNMLFLGTIMSVIIMKLRRTNDSELRKIQKTIRATLILLPLLGIINIFHLFDYPLDGSSTGFAIWAYFTHFFRSFQGVFISFIYCFSNGEVRKAIKKKFERRTWFRFGWLERRRGALAAVNPRELPIFAIADNENIELVPLPQRTWARPSSTHMVSDIDAGPSQVEAMAEKENPPQTPMKRNVKTHSTMDIAVNFSPLINTPVRDEPVYANVNAFTQTTPNKTSYKPFTVRAKPDAEGPGVSIELPPADESLAQLTSIKMNINTQSSQEIEPTVQASTGAPDPKPDVADASTSTHFAKPKGADAGTSAPGYYSEDSSDGTHVSGSDGATWKTQSWQSHRAYDQQKVFDEMFFSTMPRHSSEAPSRVVTRDNEYQRRHRQQELYDKMFRNTYPRRSSEEAARVTRDNECRRASHDGQVVWHCRDHAMHASRRDMAPTCQRSMCSECQLQTIGSSNIQDEVVVVPHPMCAVHNARRWCQPSADQLGAVGRTPSIERPPSIPSFDRPAAVPKSKGNWITKCLCGGSKKKYAKRSASLDEARTFGENSEYYRHFEVYSPARRSSGCAPHTMPRRSRPFVRPGLKTRDSYAPGGIKAFSTCF